MLDALQIRGARALLDWSTSDLAERTGLTVNGLNKIEREKVNAHKDTLDKIRSVFESEGVEFLPGSGLRRKDTSVTLWEGVDCNRRLNEDVFEHLSAQGGGELLVMHGDETSMSKNLDQAYWKEEIARRTKANITHRFLVRGACLDWNEDLKDSYHEIPQENSSPFPLFIYGRRLALFLPEGQTKVVHLKRDRMAASARHLFDFVWDHTKALPRKKKKEGGDA